MSSESFSFWLQGFAETCNPGTITDEQWNKIKQKLATVRDNSPELYSPPMPQNQYCVAPDPLTQFSDSFPALKLDCSSFEAPRSC